MAQNIQIETIPPTIPTKKAMELLGVCRNTLKDLKQRKKFRSVRFGKKDMWLTDDILKYINKHCK